MPFDNPVFDFLASKHYKVKTYKLGKFGVVSQGLALPLSAFPQLGDLPVNSAVTEKLNITYIVKEDNERKQVPQEKLPRLVSKHFKPDIKNCSLALLCVA